MKDKKTLRKEMGQHIKAIRKKYGLSVEEVAYKCGKDYQSIVRLENGRMNPSMYYLYEVSIGYGVPVKDLIDF